MKSKARNFFKRCGRSLWLSDRLTALFMASVIAVVLFSVTAFADPPATGSTETNTNIAGQDMTISRFSEIIAEAFNRDMSESMNLKGATKNYISNVDKANASSIATGGKNQFTLGNVGNVLAYAGGNDSSSNVSNIWTKGTDASSKMLTLETIMAWHEGTDSELETSALAQYIVWGSALNSLGVDEFRDAKGASDGIRMVVGYAAYVFFILAYTAGKIMNQVVEILEHFNVFMWFWEESLDGLAWLLAGGKAGTTVKDVPLLLEISDALTQAMWLRWVILGFAVLLFIASITVWKTQSFNRAGNVQQRGRKLLYRLIIMCIGVPLCGMFYTEALNIIGHFTDDANHVVTTYVFQEFMNFEAWTVRGTTDNGTLSSFKLANGKGYGTNVVKVFYNTNGQTFEVLQGGEAATKASIDKRLDASEFVFRANQGCYGTDITGEYTDIDFIKNLYGKDAKVTPGGSAPMTYEQLLNSDVEITDQEGAYKACRDLLLNYARSSTVTPDTLNEYYAGSVKELTDLLYATTDTGTAGNEAASKNATVFEKLFGVNAGDQRIWSYVELDPPWVYSVKDSAKELTLLDLPGNKVTVKLNGLAAASSAVTGSENYVSLTGPGGSANIMSGVLDNTYVKTKTTTIKKPGIAGLLGGTMDVTTSNAYTNHIAVKDGAVKTTKTGSEGSGGATVAGGSVNNTEYIYVYDLSKGGMSPLAMYNYLHSKFENGTLTVYDPALTTNAGVGTMHYAVTTPYSGIPELVQLAYTIAILFSLGILGWVFGVSLLINSIVQFCKALPVMLKIVMGSLQGFVEGLLIVFSVAIEMLITIALYSLSVKIIDFVIRLVGVLANFILENFTATVTNPATGAATTNIVDGETYAILSGCMSTAVIVWTTFQLIKWRVAITVSIKSMVTHVLNQIFGTSAAMPTGASSGLLKAGAMAATAGLVAGSLAEQGALDDVVNDLTQSDLGTSLHDKIEDGDWEGAMEDVRDYANGTYTSDTGDGDIDRGENAEDWAQQRLGDGADSLDGTFGMQSLTDAQQQELDDEFKDDALAAADKLEEARKSGDSDKIKEAQDELDDILDARAEKAAEMRAENGRKARELGVADYGDYLRSQGEDAEAQGLKPIEGADIPEEPEKELTGDAQAAYDAARDGDAETLRSTAGIFDENGLTEEQREAVNEAVKNGASEAQVAEMVEGFAEENFGENHAAVVDKMNEAAGRSSGALYGDSDNSDGNARTMAVASGHDEEGRRTYGVKDNSSNEGAKTFTTADDGNLEQTFSSELPEDPGQRLSWENQDTYDAAVNNDQEGLEAAAERLDENGLTERQAADIDKMVESGASAEDIAAKVDQYASRNLGENHKAVMERVNAAAGRGNSATYGKSVDGEGREVQVRAKAGSLDGTDWGVTDSDAEGKGEATFQADGKGHATELPTAISDAPSKGLSAQNQAIFEAARDGDTGMLQQMAGHVNGQGLDHAQEQVVRDMIASGASEAEVAAAIDNFAQDNFGNDYKQVIDKMNQAAGRDGTVTYSTPTGGGEDGTQPRSMSVTSGWNDGKAAYSVSDALDPDGASSMIEVSDENGQSIYTDVTGGRNGERLVTADFGQFDGQTYGSIRSEVDTVANASGGMIKRGAGSGKPGETTVSEAASEIAARQSREMSGGRATARVGSSGFGAESADIRAFNRAAEKAAENSGLEKGQVAGIAGGVDRSTGMASTTLPVQGEQPVDLFGNNVPNENGQVTLISSGTDSYGRSLQSEAAGQGINVGQPPQQGTPAQASYGMSAQGGPQAAYDPGIPGGTQSAAPALGTAPASVPGEGISYGAPSVPNTSAAPTVLRNGGVSTESIPVVGTPSQPTDAAAAAEQIAAGGVEASAPGGEIFAPAQEAANAPATQGGPQTDGPGRKIDLATTAGIAAAGLTFVKTGSLSSAASSYMGTHSMVRNVAGQLSETQQEIAGEPAAPQGQPAQTGGTQYQQGGSVQAAGTPQTAAPVSTASVQTVGGGTITVARGSDGAIYSVDQGGAMTSQVMARTADNKYVPVTTGTDGKAYVPGGGQAVELTSGDHVVITKDSSGNTVLADAAGNATGTIVTRTADGWQPAVKSSNGATYSVNEAGAGTGSVVVKSADGSNVSVVRDSSGTVYMADKDGGASGVPMVMLAGGAYAPVTKTADGRTVIEGAGGNMPGDVRVVRMENGTAAAVVQTESGSWRMAGNDGQPSFTVVHERADGTWGSGPAPKDNGTGSGGTNPVKVSVTVDGAPDAFPQFPFQGGPLFGTPAFQELLAQYTGHAPTKPGQPGTPFPFADPEYLKLLQDSNSQSGGDDDGAGGTYIDNGGR